jgi:hypothetical protein
VACVAINSTPAGAAPCDQPGYVFMRHLWPSEKQYKEPFGVQSLNRTDTKPLLLDINSIRAACDADERCTIFTTNGRLLAMTLITASENKTDIKFKWRKYYCGPCNDQDLGAKRYEYEPFMAWQGMGCCGSSQQDALVPRTRNFFTSNQMDSNGKRCCGSYIAAEVYQSLLHLATQVMVAPFQALNRPGLNFASETGRGQWPYETINTYSANVTHCNWLRQQAGKHPTCCPACIERLCKRVEAAVKQQGPALQKLVAALPEGAAGNGSAVGPCCRPVFTAHSNEDEYYCAELCSTSGNFSAEYGAGVGFPTVRRVGTGSAQVTSDLEFVVDYNKNPCPVACNASTRGMFHWTALLYPCGAPPPGMQKVAQQYMFIKSKGAKQGQQGRGASISKKQCTKSGSVFLC